MRLVTRGDLDGLVSAVLLTTMEDISSIELIHPQDITDNKFEIKQDDVMANLPYNPNCALWFDHHELTESNLKPPPDFKGSHAIERSVARVIYNYYSSEKLKKFEFLVSETDCFDSANLTIMDVISPEGVILLGFTIDPRTGLIRYRNFFIKLVGWLRELEIKEVMKLPEVVERAEQYEANNIAFSAALEKYSRADGNVIITDFRNLDEMPIGNRFLIYTVFPQCNVSVRLQWGPKKEFVAVTIGHSIFNRTCSTNIGHLCSDFGGGGHKGAGGCVLKPDTADEQIKEIIKRLR
jgi:oligoribonuclease NrnB/cAMP/cGMP phosphodiesterase (DHH superfamily)